jgi:hypothetical protein
MAYHAATLAPMATAMPTPALFVEIPANRPAAIPT